MTLGEVIDQIERLEPMPIYAMKPWSPSAPAIVAVEPEDGKAPRRLDYFLEVGTALEAAQVSGARNRFERVLYYAENDAFLPGHAAGGRRCPATSLSLRMSASADSGGPGQVRWH